MLLLPAANPGVLSVSVALSLDAPMHKIALTQLLGFMHGGKAGGIAGSEDDGGANGFGSLGNKLLLFYQLIWKGLSWHSLTCCSQRPRQTGLENLASLAAFSLHPAQFC